MLALPWPQRLRPGPGELQATILGSKRACIFSGPRLRGPLRPLIKERGDDIQRPNSSFQIQIDPERKSAKPTLTATDIHNPKVAPVTLTSLADTAICFSVDELW